MGEECSRCGQLTNVHCFGGKSDAGRSVQNTGVEGRSVASNGEIKRVNKLDYFNVA